MPLSDVERAELEAIVATMVSGLPPADKRQLARLLQISGESGAAWAMALWALLEVLEMGTPRREP